MGLVRHHGGTIELLNAALAPVSGSTLRSSTRGARISTAPATVVMVRGRAWPLRSNQPVATLVASVHQRGDVGVGLRFQSGGQHAPSALPADLSQRGPALITSGSVSHYSLSIGVSFLAGAPTPPARSELQRRRYAAP